MPFHCTTCREADLVAFVEKEARLGRMCGPIYDLDALERYVVSPLLAVPKGSGWRICHDLSFPEESGINAHVHLDELRRLRYASVDDAVAFINELHAKGTTDVYIGFTFLSLV